MTEESLSRTSASAAVEESGWRLLLGSFTASVAVDGLDRALQVAATAASACGGDAGDHLRIDVRADRVELTLQPRGAVMVTARDAQLAIAIADAVQALGLALSPPTGTPRPVQVLEIAIDALDIPSVRPFWKAVLDYEDEPGAGPAGALVDPARQGPSVWFQQMDEPRRQRNRIHFDLDVAHDDARRRVQAALDAGGVLVSDASARSFWVLADAEGNEMCVCTWQDRE
jgi:4a-hydroxytetrahydrobiopterin dehydratase